MKNNRITYVLPTRNEAATIGAVIDEIHSLSHDFSLSVSQIIVTDDSQDDTRKIAEQKGARVIVGGGQGLGQAMYRALKVACRDECDAIVSLDTDGQVDLKEIERFVRPVLDDQADLVLGSRFLENNLVHYKYPFINRFGTIILASIIRKLTGLTITDSHGGIRAMKIDVARELELIGTHTYVQESIIDAAEKGFRIIEIPSVWNKRNHGSSRIVGSIPKYVFYTLPVLILRSGQHIKFLYPLGMFFIFLSILDFFIVGVETSFNMRTLFDRQSFHLILLLFMIGLNLFFFGFTIELVSNIKRKINFDQ